MLVTGHIALSTIARPQHHRLPGIEEISRRGCPRVHTMQTNPLLQHSVCFQAAEWFKFICHASLYLYHCFHHKHTQEGLSGSFFRSSTGKCWQDFAQSLNFKVVPRLFTSHPHSYNNDLQTTLWVTQRCFYSFKRFDDQRLRQCRGQLLFRFQKKKKKHYFTDEGVDHRNVWKNKNIFVSPIASSVNHHLNFKELLIAD